MRIVLASGDGWREQRGATAQILTDLCQGRNSQAVGKIQEEVARYVEAIARAGTSDPHWLTVRSVCNSLSSLVMGTAYQYHDPAFQRCLQLVEGHLVLIREADCVNFLRGFPLVLTNMEGIREEVIQPQVDRHLRNKGRQTMDFMFAYLDRMKKLKRECRGSATTLSESQLPTVAGDLIIKGTETVAVRWALLLLAHSSHVQHRCRAEIQDVVGTNRRPGLHDRPRLVYMEATIREILRFADVMTFAIQHAHSCDVNLRGYVIPKDAIILPFMTTALHDQATWGDPDSFRPERFIDDEGGLIHPPEFVPFGMGASLAVYKEIWTC
ncbi:hypothetical protein ACOMHN_061314 [Nucella lapillus]